MKDFQQINWDETVEADCLEIVRLAVREDLDRSYDWTTVALVPSEAEGRAAIVVRQDGVIAGLCAAEVALADMETPAKVLFEARDGDHISDGQTVARIEGPVRSLLTSERILLNLIGRLSGIATLSSQYVARISGTKAKIYDTRKTTPGWRRLEKYAVRCGGGNNHRTGLFDAILIKDNHLAFCEQQGSAGEAVRRIRQFLEEARSDAAQEQMIIEVEVDTLSQMRSVLAASPDIVLLDNMTPDDLRAAVAMRDELAASVELEASGGVNLTTVLAIAETGVDRISVGALTHSAVSLDVGLDWLGR